MKKYIIGLLFVLCTANIYAQNVDETRSVVWEVADFSKGLNSHANDYVTPNNGSREARNVRFNTRHWSVAKRNIEALYGSIGSYKVTGLHRFYKSNNDKVLMAAGDTNMYVGDDEARTFQIARSGLTQSRRWQFVTYKDIAIGMNGYDRALKYDGATDVGTDVGDRTSGELCADLGAPFATLTASGNLSASSWYSYKIVFKDDDNLLYYSDAVSNPI